MSLQHVNEMERTKQWDLGLNPSSATHLLGKPG